jgi:hypothetical protein
MFILYIYVPMNAQIVYFLTSCTHALVYSRYDLMLHAMTVVLVFRDAY